MKEVLMTIESSTIIEVELKTGQKEYNVGRQAVLEGKRVKSIVTYASGLTKDGNTIADPSNAYLTLRDSNSEKEPISIPLRSLIYTPAYPPLQFQRIEGTFNWDSSKIALAANPTAGQRIQLLVIYDK